MTARAARRLAPRTSKWKKRPNRPPTATLSVERSPRLPGEHTGVISPGSDPDGDPLTYSYSASGGQITGTASNATFDATGLQPGSYTVKCTVNDGRGGTADATGNVEVEDLHKRNNWKCGWRCIAFISRRRSRRWPGRTGGLLASQAVTLDTLATDFLQYLTYKPDAHLILGGHADVRGGTEYNQLLSERRVKRAEDYSDRERRSRRSSRDQGLWQGREHVRGTGQEALGGRSRL